MDIYMKEFLSNAIFTEEYDRWPSALLHPHIELPMIKTSVSHSNYRAFAGSPSEPYG